MPRRPALPIRAASLYPVAGKSGLAGELGPVAADALDGLQGGEVAAGTPCRPGDRPGPAGAWVWGKDSVPRCSPLAASTA